MSESMIYTVMIRLLLKRLEKFQASGQLGYIYFFLETAC